MAETTCYAPTLLVEIKFSSFKESLQMNLTGDCEALTFHNAEYSAITDYKST